MIEKLIHAQDSTTEDPESAIGSEVRYRLRKRLEPTFDEGEKSIEALIAC
jgi:hypothetical protein